MTVTDRVVTFAPGPSLLPDEVVEAHVQAVRRYGTTGRGILELGHRSDVYEELHASCVETLRSLLNVPEAYEVLLLHGGARLQFTMLPANHLPAEGVADYLDTGHFSAAAASEATTFGHTHLAASTRSIRYQRLPREDEVSLSSNAAYLHYTSNNTEVGTQFQRPPTPRGSTWLACDASSDLLTREFDIGAHGFVYATSHKNLGTAGVGIVVIHRNLLASARPLPAFLSYESHAQASSRLNTPPISAIHVLHLMLRWTASRGGVKAMERMSALKSETLYGVIDGSDFYQPSVATADRSKVNVTFAAPTPELEQEFQDEAAKLGMVGLWGYRKVGHLRASLFNAISLEATNDLADFMVDFANRHRRRMQPPDERL